MRNDIWAIWGDLNFVIPMLGFIVVIIIAILFECKYLDERKKNQCLMKYAAKPTIAPLKPTRTTQKATEGTCQSGLTPIGITTKVSAITVITNVIATPAILLGFIKHIIRMVKKLCQPKKNDTEMAQLGVN